MRQRRQAKQSTPVEGHQFCPLCGESVPVSPDGRCDLGHRVNAPDNPTPDQGVVADPVLSAAAASMADTESAWPTDEFDDAEPVPDWDDPDLPDLNELGDDSSRQDDELSDDADEPQSDLGGELDW